MRSITSKIALFLVFVSAQSFAQETLQGLYKIENAPSHLILRVKQTPAGRFDTEAFNGLEGQIFIDAKSILMASQIRLDVARISSVVALRDEHIKTKHFEVATYPKIDLLRVRSQGPLKGTGKIPFKAYLKVKKSTTPVEGSFSITKDPKNPELLKLKAELKTQMSKVSITPPTYFGVGVEDEVEIFVDATLSKAGKATPTGWNMDNDDKFIESLSE